MSISCTEQQSCLSDLKAEGYNIYNRFLRVFYWLQYAGYPFLSRTISLYISLDSRLNVHGVCGESEDFVMTEKGTPDMMTSSNRNIFRVTGPLCGEFTGEFPSQRPVTRNFDIFFDQRLNKRFSEQSWGSWFETPSRSSWRHCNDHKIGQLWTGTVTTSKHC